MDKSWKRWLWLTLAGLPAAFPIFLILRYGVDFRFLDEWESDIAGIFIKAQAHTLTFADLIAQHNEHRIFIPRLLYLLIYPMVNWNNIGIMIAGWMIVCATSLLLLQLIRRTNRANHAIFLWFLCNLLMFSVTQNENWLWGMGLANFTPTIFIFAAFLIAISRMPLWGRLIPCMLLASAAAYSSGNGILAWPLAGVLLAWSETREEWTAKKWAIAVWIVAFGAILVLYRIGYQKPEHGGFDPTSTSPSAIFVYFLAFMGNGFAYSTPWDPIVNSVVLGSVMLLMMAGTLIYFVILWRNGRREVCRRMVVWFMVGGFGICSGLIAALFRAGFGSGFAIHSRYVTYSIYLPIALINLIPLVLMDLKDSMPLRAKVTIPLPTIGVTLLVLLEICAIPRAMTESDETRSLRRQGKGALILLNILPDNPLLRHVGLPTPRHLLENANALNELGYLHPPLVRANDVEAIRHTNKGDWDDVAGAMDQFVQTSPGQFRAIGWGLFPNQHQLTDCIFITYEEPGGKPAIFEAANLLIKREDIAEKMNNSDYEWCGWEVDIQLQNIPADVHAPHLTAWVLDIETGKATQLPGVAVVHH